MSEIIDLSTATITPQREEASPKEDVKEKVLEVTSGCSQEIKNKIQNILKVL